MSYEELLVKDGLRRINRLRLAYNRLKRIDGNNVLLTLIELREDVSSSSPYPGICPSSVVWKITPAFFSKYDLYGKPVRGANPLIEFSDGLEKYTVDLELEARKIQRDRGIH